MSISMYTWFRPNHSFCMWGARDEETGMLLHSCNTKVGWQNRERYSEDRARYTTHLRPTTIKRIKVYAANKGIKDYEVAQMAFDLFFLSQEQQGS